MKYQAVGQGKETIILVHGFCADYKVWDYFVEQLSDSFKIVAVAIPGYLSDQDPMTESLDALAEEIYKIIQLEKLSEVHYVGHSMGGYIGLCLMEKYPTALKAMTLLNSHCFNDEEDKKTNREKSILFIQKNGTTAFIKEIYKTLFSKEFQANHPEDIDSLKERANTYAPEVLIQSCKAMINRRNHEKTLKESKIPVQFILGKKDGLIPIETFIKQAMLPPVAQVKVFEEMGHMGMFEFPQPTLLEIVSFNKYATNLKTQEDRNY